MDKREPITVRKFLLKKFPTNEYMDCPVPKHYWEIMDEYASLVSAEKEAELEAEEKKVILLEAKLSTKEAAIKELVTGLEKIEKECKESGLKHCDVEDPLHMAIYHSLHLAKPLIQKYKQ